MNKPRFEPPNLTAENMTKLAELFPNAVIRNNGDVIELFCSKVKNLLNGDGALELCEDVQINEQGEIIIIVYWAEWELCSKIDVGDQIKTLLRRYLRECAPLMGLSGRAIIVDDIDESYRDVLYEVCEKI